MFALLLALATITLAARATGAFFQRVLKQPAVMGEIAAGILLGPSALGALWPAARTALIDPGVEPALGVVAQLGVVLFMFLVGLELDPRSLRGQARVTLAMANVSIAVPFLLGAGLGHFLFARYGRTGTDLLVFSLFIGLSLSVTAFPVLARILIDRKMHDAPLGKTALALAAVGDATAWCLLALIAGLARHETGGAGVTVALSLAFLALLFFAVRPLVRWRSALEDTHDRPVSHNVLAGILALMLLCAAATEFIGIHALFGAFAAGVLIPRDGRLAHQLRARMEDLVSVLLLPVFFAFTGLRTELGLLNSPADWAICGLVIAVATAGKLGGTALAARFFGMGWRDSATLGVLMNTRGLMELIVLNVGLDLGILSPTLFTALVVMALVTTFMTAPLLRLIGSRA